MNIGSLEHERAIVEAVTLKKREAFGNNEVFESPESPLAEKIAEFIKETTKNWPKAPRSGSRFVGISCAVCPRLDVTLNPNSLFLDQISQKNEVGPLSHPMYGRFTTENSTLSVRNIRLLNDVEQAAANSSEIVVNNKQPIHLNASANKKLRFLVDVQFGEILNKKDLVIEGEKVDTSIKLKIPLFTLKGKVGFDGSVTLTEKISCDGQSVSLQHGATFNLHDIPNLLTKKVRWVNFPCIRNVPFTC